MGRATAIVLARPLGRGQQVIFHLISITKTISKIFIPNYSRIFILLPGSCTRGGTWGCLGFKNQILSRRLSVMISPPKPLDQIQPNEVCELLTCMGRATAKVNLALPTGVLWRGQKVK